MLRIIFLNFRNKKRILKSSHELALLPVKANNQKIYNKDAEKMPQLQSLDNFCQ